MFNAQTKLNMVIGFPLHHTQSPCLHNYLYQLFNINAVLLAFAQQDLTALLAAIKNLAVEFTAVTMPFKEVVVPYLDVCSAEVTELQTANTIINRQGILHGYNTDIDGIAYALRHVNLTGKQVLILGAGGAAQALAYFLQKQAAIISCHNRTLDKARQLADKFDGKTITLTEINSTAFDVIINTTAIGMAPNSNQSLLADYQFNNKQTVFDMVYNPYKTQLLTRAASHGASIISGLDMFIGQAFKQFELYSGQRVDSEEVFGQTREMLLNYLYLS